MARPQRYGGSTLPPGTTRYVVPADGWIPQAKIHDWVSSRIRKSTNKEFWTWAVVNADLDVLRKGKRMFVSEESLRRYTGAK